METNLFSRVMIRDRIGPITNLLQKVQFTKMNEKNKQSCCFSFWLLVSIVTIFLLLIGQKARNSGCDWFIQLSDNRCPITVFC